MNDRKIMKLAQKDAEKFLSAEMAYGQGAGTRRKLVKAEIDQKMIDLADTDYADIFDMVYHNLDLNQFAKAAIRERKSLDRAMKTSKNFRAIRSGNLNNLSTGAFLVAGAVIVARQTGYDKKIEAEVKKLYANAKRKLRRV